MFSGWRWEKKGGDWIDADGVRHGPKPWARQATVANAATPVVYTIDVTAALQRVRADGRWCAFKVTATKIFLKIASLWATDITQRPRLLVTYTDSTQADLTPVITAACAAGSPSSIDPILNLPAFIEFDQPTTDVQSAALMLTVVAHSSGIGGEIQLQLLDPPINADPVQHGAAAYAGPLDLGIEAVQGIIGAQRYVDGSVTEDFLLLEPLGTNFNASRGFDPALWGGTPDTTKLPHKGLGKWMSGYPGRWTDVVPSTYADEGFEPLAPGLGALRLHMPAQATADGQYVGYGGTGANNALLMMPEPLYGRLPRIFVRQYIRLGLLHDGRYLTPRDKQFHVYKGSPGSATPTRIDFGGKWGCTPAHINSLGSGSGSSGGGYGFQLRYAWGDCLGDSDGPQEGGFRPGWHLFDFGAMQPPGYSYAGASNSGANWGQRGGLGSMLYAGQWYCVETEVKLNSVDKPGILADGTPHIKNGVPQFWTPDGALRTWIDGRLAFERTGMVFRSMPKIASGKPPDDKMWPVRELGVAQLWWTWYHGGVVQNSVPRTMFMTGLAYGQEYIGPMRLG